MPLASAGTMGTHRLTEALKHAFAMRMNLGDPETAGGLPNLTSAMADMLSPEFNARLRGETSDDATKEATAYGARWNQLDDSGTTHLSVLDEARNAVAMTSTINTPFGSKVVSPSTGILLNNEMDDFSSPGVSNGYGLAPSEANYIAPRKRPLSSMSPTVVLDKNGRVFAVAGASGGPRIITSTAQVLLNVLARGADPLSAVNRPRLHHQVGLSLPGVRLVT
jgi:gamma-glutamyltranspeptidase/glutathione hydrolase/leukotriene-C4 hydrolase